MIILLLGWMAIDDKCERRDKLLLLQDGQMHFIKTHFILICLLHAALSIILAMKTILCGDFNKYNRIIRVGGRMKRIKRNETRGEISQIESE